jgi:hypothetical protein
LGLLAQCFQGYRGYVLAGWQILGPWTVPLALISGLGAVSELASIIALVVTSVGYAVLFFFFGWGAHAEFAMRAYAGLPVSSREIWRLQFRRLIPWLVELLPSMLISFVGCAITLVAFGPMLTPVYMVEGVNGLRINSRSVELLGMNWFLGLVPLAIVITLAGLMLLVGSTALQLIPFVGNWLAALFGPMFAAAVLPFILFVQFAAYGATRKFREGVDVAELIRKELE